MFRDPHTRARAVRKSREVSIPSYFWVMIREPNVRGVNGNAVVFTWGLT